VWTAPRNPRNLAPNLRPERNGSRGGTSTWHLGRVKARLRPMRGLKTDRTTKVIVAGHAFLQNIRRGHYELAIDERPAQRLIAASDELLLAFRY
jgi:hypothetical protein